VFSFLSFISTEPKFNNRVFVVLIRSSYRLVNPDPKLYQLTGHHIGTDFRAPVGTPLLSPSKAFVTRTGFSKTLGYWCEMQVDDWYMVALHLRERPKMGTYRKGDVFAYIGDTGFIQGVHAHLEGWYKPMNRQALTKDTWKTLTFDIMNKFN